MTITDVHPRSYAQLYMCPKVQRALDRAVEELYLSSVFMNDYEKRHPDRDDDNGSDDPLPVQRIVGICEKRPKMSKEAERCEKI